ncbi:hypothetical protein Tco_0830950 [Tanacetum coccineum]
MLLVTSAAWPFSSSKHKGLPYSKCSEGGHNYCTDFCQSEDAYCVDDNTCICDPERLMESPSMSPTDMESILSECDPDCKELCESEDSYCDDGTCFCDTEASSPSPYID